MAVLVDNLTPRLLALLWSTVLLSRGAADCPIPPDKEHIVLTDESRLKNGFPKDTKVTYDCTNGYEKHNGSNSITCTGTEWTEPDLTCKKKDCGYPQQLPNMIYIVNNGTLFGAHVRVTCEEGYRIIGTSSKRCFHNGWIGRGSCRRVVCKVPSEVNDGQHTWTSAEQPHYGNIIQYSCDPGFTLNGTSHIICQGRGVYNTTPPTCEEDESTTPTLNITSTPRPSIQGGIYTFAATEDNRMNTEASSSSSPSLVAATVPATPVTHGRNLMELDNIKEPDRDTMDAVSLRRNIVVVSVIGTLLVVFIVVLIFYVYRYRGRRGNAITSNEEYKVCYQGGSEGHCGPAFLSQEPHLVKPQKQ